MWLITWRDLMFRRRRFLIAVVVTAVVFGLALATDGLARAGRNEVPRTVDRFGADAWIVAKGASGPFTTTQVIPESLAKKVGGTETAPIVVSRTTIDDGGAKSVNVVAAPPGSMGAPQTTDGRAPKDGEVAVDTRIGYGIGDRIETAGKSFVVVGKVRKASFNMGTPTMFLTLHDVQELMMGGQRFAMAIAVRGEPSNVPAKYAVVRRSDALSDLERDVKPASDTIKFTSIMLWLVAAGVIGAIVYLSALERVRDFAVLKATGVSTGSIVGGLALQAVILTMLSAILSFALSRLLSLAIPLPVEITTFALVQLLVIAVVVGLLASLAGVRRAVGTDPAYAFGG